MAVVSLFWITNMIRLYYKFEVANMTYDIMTTSPNVANNSLHISSTHTLMVQYHHTVLVNTKY